MARPLRIAFEGALYHVTSRGDRQENVYETDDDRNKYLSILCDVCNRFNWEVHAYCLMSNHYHLLIETHEANLSKGMRQLNGVYSQAFNRNHGLVGHVFQGRFKSILVEKESYLLELSRYIVLNPVRAGMVDSAAQWPWSSYRQTIGLENRQAFLNVEYVLSHFSRSPRQAVQLYSKFVSQGRSHPSPWKALKNQIFLGSDDFVEAMQSHIDDNGLLDEIPYQQKSRKPHTIDYYFTSEESRNECVVNAFTNGGYSMKEIGNYLNLHNSTISKIIKRSRFKT